MRARDARFFLQDRAAHSSAGAPPPPCAFDFLSRSRTAPCHETAQLPRTRARSDAAMACTTHAFTALLSVCAVTPIQQRLAHQGCGPRQPLQEARRLHHRADFEMAHGPGWRDAEAAGIMRSVVFAARERAFESRATRAPPWPLRVRCCDLRAAAALASVLEADRQRSACACAKLVRHAWPSS